MTGIDHTQFLPRETPVVNGEWISKHGIKLKYADGIHESSSAWVKVSGGIVTQASEKDNSILNYLVTFGFIEICHMDCALSYMELRHAYTSKSSYKSNSIYLSKFITGADISKRDVERVYEYIFSGIGKKAEKLVIYACDEKCDSKSGCQNEPVANAYRKALETLLAASDEIWSTIKQESMQNALAS
jgi:hypothetical protein